MALGTLFGSDDVIKYGQWNYRVILRPYECLIGDIGLMILALILSVRLMTENELF